MKTTKMILFIAALLLMATALPVEAQIYSTTRSGYPAYGGSVAGVASQPAYQFGSTSSSRHSGSSYSSSTFTPGAGSPRKVLNAGFTVDTDDCRAHIDDDRDGICDDCGTPLGGNIGTPGGDGHTKDDMLPVGNALLPMMLLALGYAAIVIRRKRRA